MPLAAWVFRFLGGQYDIHKLYNALHRGPLQRNGWRLHHVEIPGILLLLGVGQFKILFREPRISISIIILITALVGFVGLREQTIGQATSTFHFVLKGSNGRRVSESTRSHNGIACSSSLGIIDSSAACFWGWTLLIYGEMRAMAKSEGSHWNFCETK